MLELNKLYCMDCMEGMAQFPDKHFDLAIVDPPYGIGITKKNLGEGGGLYRQPRKYKRGEWDGATPGVEYFTELKRISCNQVVWGGNYFGLNGTPCWLVWDKNNGGSDFADCELAWTSYKSPVRKFTFMWSGAWQGSPADGSKMQGNKKLNEKRIHPTQKPVQLYKWLLKNYAKPEYKIIDTHAGSCSSVIAFLDFGCEWIAFEIDKDYYEAASKRIENHKMQLKIF